MSLEQLLGPLSSLEQLLYNVVRVTAHNSFGESWYGTGFFVDSIPVGPKRAIPTLVTNRHVLAGASRIELALHTKSSEEHDLSGKHVIATIELSPNLLIWHPDEDVDLAACLVGPLFRKLAAQGIIPFRLSVGFESLPEEHDYQAYDVLEDVVMVGCPNGIFDSANNFPIMRRGITATHLAIRYEGRPEFVVDLACFGGSSGSPIFTWRAGRDFDRATGKYAEAPDRFRLIGVLYAGPVFEHDGTVSFQTVPKVSVATTMHLGFAIRASEIRRMLAPVGCKLPSGECETSSLL